MKDATGQPIAYVYFEDELQRQMAAIVRRGAGGLRPTSPSYLLQRAASAMADMAARDIACLGGRFILHKSLHQRVRPNQGRVSDGTGDFCQCIVGLVGMGILYGDRLGAWYVGRGAIVGDGVARAAVDSPHRVRQAHRSRRGCEGTSVK